ncbi:MAG TPA: sensor histidine kinase [Microscillaceae bacterium]|nr:sensor histidine kinase [Microscillaceae bacterium]
MQFLLQQILKYRLVRHVLYWVGITLFFTVAWGTHDHDYWRSLSIQAFGLPARMVLVYGSLYVLIPRFFIPKKFFIFSLAYFSLLLLAGVGIQRPIIWFYVEPLYFPTWNSAGFFTVTEITNTLLDINNAAIFPLGYTFFKHYFLAQQKALQLEKERLRAELDRLKHQIQPHFLFNNLNSLYSLVIKKSDQAPKTLLKLSQLMRYMLYEADGDEVPLSKEIAYLQNYVDLERLRFEENVDISLNIEQDRDYPIAPFLLMPFVENAFKHGTKGKQAWIVIHLMVQNAQLILKVENGLVAPQNQPLATVGGIGFANVQQRLDLLYPKRHTLKVHEDELSYEVILKIQLPIYEQAH